METNRRFRRHFRRHGGPARAADGWTCDGSLVVVLGAIDRVQRSILSVMEAAGEWTHVGCRRHCEKHSMDRSWTCIAGFHVICNRIATIGGGTCCTNPCCEAERSFRKQASKQLRTNHTFRLVFEDQLVFRFAHSLAMAWHSIRSTIKSTCRRQRWNRSRSPAAVPGAGRVSRVLRVPRKSPSSTGL